MDEITTTVAATASLEACFTQSAGETDCGSAPLRYTQNGYNSGGTRCHI